MVFGPLIPFIAHADGINISVKDLMYRISYHIVNPIIQVGFAIAVLYLVWKVILYIKDRNSGYIFEDGKDGKEKVDAFFKKDDLYLICTLNVGFSSVGSCETGIHCAFQSS